MKNLPVFFSIAVSCLALLLAGFALLKGRQTFPRLRPENVAAVPAVPLAPGEWRFIVSGDSRNCGNIVMPAIAAHSAKFVPSFYWHLGDLRAIYKTDEDMEAAAAKNGQILSCAQYFRRAWPNFIESQIAPFANTAFFIGIGNHEVIPPKDVNQFVTQFSAWLASPVLNQQREADGEKDPDEPRSYYHWIQGSIDFLYLDNSSNIFPAEEVAWFDRIIKKTRENPNVLGVVVGMHEALPDSISGSHAMCDHPENAESCQSGRHVYQVLLDLQKHKHIYVLASHSHYYMHGTFDNQPPERRLPGWIVGTAGAVRYRLPLNAPADSATDAYGYLLGAVARDGQIRFDFQQVKQDDVPSDVRKQYPSWLTPWCFAHNSQNIDPIAEETTHRCVAAKDSGH